MTLNTAVKQGDGGHLADHDTIATFVNTAPSIYETQSHASATYVAQANAPTNVKDHGAVGDGVADDTTAIQAALNAGTTSVYFPPGTYLVSAALTRSGQTSLIGAGMRASRIINSAATGNGLTVTLGGTGIRETCEIADLAVIAQTFGSGRHGIHVIGSVPADRYTPSVVMRNVEASWDTGTGAGAWDVGIYLDGCPNAYLTNCYINGKVATGGEPNYDSTYGIQFSNASAESPHPTEYILMGCSVRLCKTGIRADDFEGLVITTSQIIGCNKGVDAEATTTYPYVSILNSHINASAGAVLINDVYETFIANNLIYSQNSNATGVYGVTITGAAKFFSIVGNTFENQNASTYKLNGIIISSGTDGLIENNLFRRCDTTDTLTGGLGIWLTSGASNVLVGDGNRFSSTATTILNQATSQGVQQVPTPKATFTVAALPTASLSPGAFAYASNGRKAGEGAGAGTGVMCYSDGTAWRTVDASTTVAA